MNTYNIAQRAFEVFPSFESDQFLFFGRANIFFEKYANAKNWSKLLLSRRIVSSTETSNKEKW